MNDEGPRRERWSDSRCSGGNGGGEEAADGRERDALVYDHLGVAVDDHLVQPAMRRHHEAPVRAHLQPEAAVEKAGGTVTVIVKKVLAADEAKRKKTAAKRAKSAPKKSAASEE